MIAPQTTHDIHSNVNRKNLLTNDSSRSWHVISRSGESFICLAAISIRVGKNWLLFILSVVYRKENSFECLNETDKSWDLIFYTKKKDGKCTNIYSGFCLNTNFFEFVTKDSWRAWQKCHNLCVYLEKFAKILGKTK